MKISYAMRVNSPDGWGICYRVWGSNII